MSLKFSIVVPAYNVEKYIERCLSSLVNQTYRDIEIVVVDDGSEDKTPEICDGFAKNDSRVTVIHKKNGGVSTARNTALENTHGDYVLFVDSDDSIEVSSCERLLPFAEAGYDILIGESAVTGGYYDTEHIDFRGEVMGGEEYLLRAAREEKMPMFMGGKIYRKKFLDEGGFRFKEGYVHEDELFTAETFLAAKTICRTGLPYYHYFIRENSITTSKDKRKNVLDMVAVGDDLRKLYDTIECAELRELMTDSVACKYLSIFQSARAYRYGKEYIFKDFVRENARLPRTKKKAALFCFSPRLYWQINNLTKKLRGNKK